MLPELRPPGATSAAKPPLVAVICPRLTTDAQDLPGTLKSYGPFPEAKLRLQPVSLEWQTSIVLARKPAELMTAPDPIKTPSPLMINTRPLASSVPSMSETPWPVTRLSAIEELLS